MVNSIRELCPDVYAKGIDKATLITQEDLVAQSLGIRVEALGNYKRSSSTDISVRLFQRFKKNPKYSSLIADSLEGE